MSVGECSTVTEVKRKISSEIIVSMRLKWFEREGLESIRLEAGGVY